MKKLDLSQLIKDSKYLDIKKKVGFVAIIGRPNSGKSTFINTLIGKKISIISNVAQTTRNRIWGIYNDLDSQIIFFDTPGIHKSNKLFNQKINNVSTSSLKEADLVLHFIDSSREYGEEEFYIKDILNFVEKPIFKVFTKCDLKAKQEIINNKNLFLISSLNKFGFENLLKKIKEVLAKGHILFPCDFYTKQNIFFRVSQIIMEKIFFYTSQEIPHSTFVRVLEIENKNNLIKIGAYIITNSHSQKNIIIGKKGSLLSKIGRESRLDLEYIFEKKIFLALRVKVIKNWNKNKNLLKKVLF